MPSAYPPRPPYPPPGGDPGESDDALAAGVRGGTDGEVAEATALLIARHWRPAHDYAVICLAGSGPVASMATGTAFHQVFDRLKLGESGTDLRPRLLLAVRETVRLWASAERVSAVLPELRKPAGARGMRAAKGMTPDNRILSEYAYHALPATERCLLWHVEVEGEPVSVPAALLGVDTSMAAAALEGARDKLREGIVRAHRELAPSKECRFYNRLLEVPLRRGGDLLPDVRRHLDACRYCRAAAEQLAQGAGWVGLMLAEAVLGWGARRYHDSRPDRGREEPVRVRGAVKRGAGRRLLDRMPSPARREESGRGRVFGAWGSGGDTQGAAEVLPGIFRRVGRRGWGCSAGVYGVLGGRGGGGAALGPGRRRCRAWAKERFPILMVWCRVGSVRRSQALAVRCRPRVARRSVVPMVWCRVGVGGRSPVLTVRCRAGKARRWAVPVERCRAGEARRSPVLTVRGRPRVVRRSVVLVVWCRVRAGGRFPSSVG
ncbi:hypothetical protein CQR58_005960 [Streptomyces acidiscabies]|uniref:hypothetical protein n=1 Tax=Streptomyces acidiscabies TaxID=42234 RepID=UPI0034C6876F